MDDENEVSEDSGDNSWVLIPLAALMIPILAVSDNLDAGSAIQIAVALSLVLAVAAVLARMLLVQRHNLRMRELRAERLIASEERQQMAHANEVLDKNRTIQELRMAVKEPVSDTAQAASSSPVISD